MLRRRSRRRRPSFRRAAGRSGTSGTRRTRRRGRGTGGVLRYEPDDLTITVGAGTTFAALDAMLAEHGQECPLDPRDERATVGGMLACGLSGIRRLRHGPIRDHVLEVRFVTADGRVVKGGGPTVKNVTGYDLPRLFVGSLGTLGVLVQVTLRCRPRPPFAQWFRTTDAPRDLFRPAAMLWDGHDVHVRLEGTRADVDAARRDDDRAGAPSLPAGAHRGRISIAPGALAALAPDLTRAGVRWCAELGVGTVHVAADSADELGAGARGRARARRLDAARSRRRRYRRLRPATAEPRADAAHQGRVRSRPASSRRDGSRCDTAERVAHAAGARRRHARRVRRVRAVPAALPDVPRDRARDRVAARAHRGDARGRATRRAHRRRLPPRDGRVRAVPRLRSGVPVGRAVRSPHGGHPRRGAPATPPAAAAPPGRVDRVPRRAALSRRARRAHVAAARRAAAASRAAPVRHPAHHTPRPAAARRPGRRRPRRVALHRLRHGRVAARHPPRPPRASCAPPAHASRDRRGRRLLRRAARARRP